MDPDPKLCYVSSIDISVVDPNTLIWTQILNFGPIWIRIQGYVINFKRKVLK